MLIKYLCNLQFFIRGGRTIATITWSAQIEFIFGHISRMKGITKSAFKPMGLHSTEDKMAP